jgi:SAM-dependent methyltransferase
MPAAGSRIPRYVDYFDRQAGLDAQFLHPGGTEATDFLISSLPELPSGSTVLEIGCGTGGTALRLLDQSDIRYVGVDASPMMLRRARTRLSRHTDRIVLIRLDLTRDELALQPGTVDMIVAESVCAILDAQSIIGQCHRLLKQGGTLAINDRIWSSGVTSSDRIRLNDLSKRMYGFHAAPDSPADSSEWIGMLNDSGFDPGYSGRIDTAHGSRSVSSGRHLSGLRTLGRLILRPHLLRMIAADRQIGKEYRSLWNGMENWIFIARKK